MVNTPAVGISSAKQDLHAPGVIQTGKKLGMSSWTIRSWNWSWTQHHRPRSARRAEQRKMFEPLLK